MKLVWSLPVPGETLDSGRGDVVRARNLIRGLEEEGHSVTVVQAGAAPGTAAAVAGYRTVVKTLVPGAAPLFRDLGRIAFARAHASRVAEVALETGAECIIETQVHMVPSGARAAARARLPLVLDDCSPASEEAALGGGLSRLASPFFRRQAAAAARLVVSSEALTRRLAAEGVAPDRVAVVPNGVAAEPYDRADRLRERARWGLGDAPTLVYVGSFQPWHRVDLLVEALAHLDPPVRALLVGDGAGREPAAAAVERLGLGSRVVFTGPLSSGDVVGALVACDIGVLAGTNSYGQPMKLMEYAAAGLPAVAPDLPPVREVVRAERTAVLFPPEQLEGLIAALARLLSDGPRRERMARAARESARLEERSWRTAARRLLDIIRAEVSRTRVSVEGARVAEEGS